MTPKEFIKHFDNDERTASLKLGYHPYTIRTWVKAGKIPHKAQQLIEYATAGKLKADKRKMTPVQMAPTKG